MLASRNMASVPFHEVTGSSSAIVIVAFLFNEQCLVFHPLGQLHLAVFDLEFFHCDGLTMHD